MANNWTPEQLLGITLTGKSLLVSAAAGSGKTAVLSERCVHLVCDAPRPCDVDELLVVTFTEKAAAEMRSRITAALRDRAMRKPSDRLTKQLALVDQAQISTLHAFCGRLLRQHFHLVGLDPGFTVMDPDEARLLRGEVARELFEKHYDDEDGQFSRLIDGYGQGDDKLVLRQVLHVHELLTSVVAPDRWLSESRQRITEAIDGPLEQSALGQELLSIIRRNLASLRARCASAIVAVTQLGHESYAKYLSDMHAAVSHWQDALADGGIDALAEVSKDVDFERMPSVRGDVPDKELAKSIVESVREQARNGSWRKLLNFSTDDWRHGLDLMLPQADIFIQLVEEFGQEYRRAKDAAHALDFSDLERFTLMALCESATKSNRPSAAAQALHRRFAHVLVDEFQDINEVQDAILSLVSRECMAPAAGNLFCVGDVKQSIYRFRLAEPARFLDRQRQFRDKRSHGRVIDLQANFRSRLPLLDALNRIFSCLMTEDAVDIEYDQSHRLLGGGDYPKVTVGSAFSGAPIDLHLLPGDLSTDAEEGPTDDEDEIEESEAIEREAMLVAMEIRRMVGMERGFEAMLVMEKGEDGKLQPRPARFRDVAILLRSMRRKADQFAAVLRRYGIDVHAASRAGYFEAMEIRDMLALLSLLDNQRQDIPLAALLRSPLGEISEPESSLARIRSAYPESIPFHEAAIRYQTEKTDLLASELKNFYARLSRWRIAARQKPLADVIWSIYHESGYLTFVAGLDQGDQRVRNLIDLHERAAQFGKFQSRGLSRFMVFLEQLEEESDLGQPSLASDAENVVRIMSVHASKGLEFPIVFLPDLGKRINMQSCRGPILADRQAGLGMKVVDETRRCRYPSLASAIVENRLVQQSLAEEMRVLYVAMTRAREHLILVGTCKKKEPDKAMQQWLSHWAEHTGALSTDAILGVSSMLDWIGPVAAMTCNDAVPVFRVKTHPPQEVAKWQAPGSTRESQTPEQMAMARLEPLSQNPPVTAVAQRVIDNQSFVYPYQQYSDMPAAQSVTSRTHAAGAAGAPTGGIASMPSEAPVRAPAALLPQPRFIEKAIHSAADRGTITHLVIEHLDYAGPCDDADIARQIDSLIDRNILTADDAAVVDRGAITWLMASPVGQLLRKRSAGVRRELPVNFPWPPEPEQGGDPLDRVMVRGRIDALIVDGRTATIVDYKTDSVTAEQVAERAETYRPQLQAYREAIQRITGLRIDDMYLAFLSPRVIHRL